LEANVITINHPERFLPFRTTREVKAMTDKEKAVVVLPVASVEQHGPHLPLFTDSLIVQEVLDRSLALLPADFQVWTLPLLCYGKSTEHTAFAGTVTLTSETFIQVLKEIAASVARSGFSRLAIVNGHGGNTEIIDFVIRDIREQTGMLVFALHVFLRVATPTAGLTEAEKTYGIHAGDVETSILLRCHPELVRRELAPSSLPVHLTTFKHPPFMGPLTFAWLTPDISRDGVLGDATLANSDKGERFLADAAEQVAGLLGDISEFNFA
jgi:creatinine amidohydrolase